MAHRGLEGGSSRRRLGKSNGWNGLGEVYRIGWGTRNGVLGTDSKLSLPDWAAMDDGNETSKAMLRGVERSRREASIQSVGSTVSCVIAEYL